MKPTCTSPTSKGGGEAVDEAAVRLNDLIRLRALVAPSQAECGKRAQLEASEEADTQAVANALPSNSIEVTPMSHRPKMKKQLGSLEDSIWLAFGLRCARRATTMSPAAHLQLNASTN